MQAGQVVALCGGVRPRSDASVALDGVVTPAAITRPGASVSRTSSSGVNSISTCANTAIPASERLIADLRLPSTRICIACKGKGISHATVAMTLRKETTAENAGENVLACPTRQLQRDWHRGQRPGHWTSALGLLPDLLE